MTQALSTFHLSHGPKNRPTLVFLPGALIPPNAIAPVTRIVKLRAVGVGWLEGAGPHDLHTIAARVAGLLEELGPTVLIGHSVGTPIAALAAAIDLRSTKSNVVGLVLSNSGANTTGHGDVESVIERVLQTWGPSLWKSMTERSLGSACPAELVGSFMTYPRRIRAEATAECLRSLQQIDLTSMLSDLSSLPTAVVHGSRDPARTLSHAQSLSNGIRGSRLVVLETGHTSCVEAPYEFAEVIRSVVEQRLRTENVRLDYRWIRRSQKLSVRKLQHSSSAPSPLLSFARHAAQWPNPPRYTPELRCDYTSTAQARLPKIPAD